VRIVTILIVVVIAFAFAGNSVASGPGKSIEYLGGDAGKVVFNGDTHGMAQGMKCNDCHPKLFAMKQGEFKMTSEDHGDTTKGCGVCHNGEKAFAQSTEEDCGKCHMKE
jgi:c(7)-type cytochrome triheme protein